MRAVSQLDKSLNSSAVGLNDVAGVRVLSVRSGLVTGGSGFIGRALCCRLLSDGWAVICVGRSNPCIDGVQYIAVPNLAPEGLRLALSTTRFDSLFHLAAYGVAPGDRDSEQMLAVNVESTLAIVRLAIKAEAEVLIYAGSCSEYAEAKVGYPIDEGHALTTASLYGASKAAAGFLGMALARSAGLGFVHMRLFGVYGEGEAPHRLLPSIISRLRRDEPVALSLGKQVRDMTYIADAVEGLLQAERIARGVVNGPFNLCSGRPVSVQTIALATADALKKPRDLLKFGALPVRPGEQAWVVGDGTAFANASGYIPSLSLDAGLSRAIALMDRRSGFEGAL